MLDDPAIRFAVGACGTKFGKTYGTQAAMTKYAWEHPDELMWWIAPTFTQAKMAMQGIVKLLPQGMYHEYAADVKLEILKPTGGVHSVIEFKSGDNPSSIRGFGVNFFVMDEAARCKYDSWISLFTTLTQTQGRGYVISTPMGRNWFYDVYQWGVKTDISGEPKWDNPRDDPHPEFKSIRMPTWMNPWVTRKAIEAFKRSLPEEAYRQEVAAEFATDSAGVFKGVRDCERGRLQAPGRSRYVMGVDLARLKDFSVITVMDAKTKNVVHFERFKDLSWPVQYNKIIEAARKYRAVVCIDSTGIGDPIVQTIQGAGVRVVPYKISSNAAKKQLVDKLRVAIENKHISYPHIPILRSELEDYEYETTDSGIIKFGPGGSGHDDCVISLCLANWLLEDAERVYQMRNFRGI